LTEFFVFVVILPYIFGSNIFWAFNFCDINDLKHEIDLKIGITLSLDIKASVLGSTPPLYCDVR
jgi:hypothetical protein